MTNSLYLEQYLDSLEPLPGELRRNFNLMHDLNHNSYIPIVKFQICSYVYSPTADNRTALVEYPCSFGFDYMVTGATVWAIFLPFHIFTLLGNCWRQCCCCLCDPLVCCSCICDLIKRYHP